MPDPIPTYRTEPAAEFADRLERVLAQRLTAPTASTMTKIWPFTAASGIDTTPSNGWTGERGASMDVEPTVAPERPARRQLALKVVFRAAAAAAFVVALTAIVRTQDDPGPADVPPPTVDAPAPTATVDPGPRSTPFEGNWLSTDTDGSSQTMKIARSNGDDHEIVVRDAAATRACAGAPSTITGTGRLGTDETMVIAQPELTCDDGTTPAPGPPPQAELANYTIVRDPATDELVDPFGVVWRREGATPIATAPTTLGDDETAPATVSETAADPLVDFTEIAPGEMVELPDWPLSQRTSPPKVWTGTELIVWGDGIYGRAGDGAAFDLANGTWRVIAQAPVSPRSESAAVWTGTEMIVWGGRVDNVFYYDGAAYNPATDTWRLLSPAPVNFNVADPTMVWTGNEAVVLGVLVGPEFLGDRAAAAAYDPITDSWRTLANPPPPLSHQRPLWTGSSIVAATAGYGDGSNNTMASYDLAADRWTTVEIGSSTAVVGVPGSDGRVSTFVNLPSETGARVQLIDSTGSPIAELPAFPADPDVFGDEIQAFGVWVGDEAVFELFSGGADYAGEQIWALNPSTQTWRRLDADTAFPRIDRSVVVAGDLLLMWNRPSDVYQGPPTLERACCVAPPSKGGSVYRVGSAATD